MTASARTLRVSHMAGPNDWLPHSSRSLARFYGIRGEEKALQMPEMGRAISRARGHRYWQARRTLARSSLMILSMLSVKSSIVRLGWNRGHRVASVSSLIPALST